MTHYEPREPDNMAGVTPVQRGLNIKTIEISMAQPLTILKRNRDPEMSKDRHIIIPETGLKCYLSNKYRG